MFRWWQHSDLLLAAIIHLTLLCLDQIDITDRIYFRLFWSCSWYKQRGFFPLMALPVLLFISTYVKVWHLESLLHSSFCEQAGCFYFSLRSAEIAELNLGIFMPHRCWLIISMEPWLRNLLRLIEWHSKPVIFRKSVTFNQQIECDKDFC